MPTCVIAAVATGLAAQSQPDIFIGTLGLENGEVVLTRCDFASNRYVLHDQVRGGPVSRYAADGRAAYGEVIGVVSGDDGAYSLSVSKIMHITPGKSCHLLDLLENAGAPPGQGSAP